MSQIEHPFNPDGSKYPHWDYSKPYAPSDAAKFEPIKSPIIWECPEHVPSAEEIEKMRKADEKRMRKRMKNLDNMAKQLFGKEDENLESPH
jgi:hypothetical protein